MKPLIEITKGLSFGGWEGGSWNSKFNIGRAILYAGPDVEKLKIVYSVPAGKLWAEKYHFLHILGVGHLIAQAYVKKNRLDFDVRITLSRIAELRTTAVQDQQVPMAEQTILWSFQGRCATLDQVLAMDYYSANAVGYREEYKQFMQAALAKATTDRSQQKSFWSLPRPDSADND